MDTTEYHAILHAELHQLKSAALAEAVTKSIKLAEGIQHWRHDPLTSCGFMQLEDMAADILRLLGEARAFGLADTLIDE